MTPAEVMALRPGARVTWRGSAPMTLVEVVGDTARLIAAGGIPVTADLAELEMAPEDAPAS